MSMRYQVNVGLNEQMWDSPIQLILGGHWSHWAHRLWSPWWNPGLVPSSHALWVPLRLPFSVASWHHCVIFLTKLGTERQKQMIWKHETSSLQAQKRFPNDTKQPGCKGVLLMYQKRQNYSMPAFDVPSVSSFWIKGKLWLQADFQWQK